MFINKYRPMEGVGVGWKCHFSRHNLSIIPPIEHDFEHKTLVSRVTPKNIVLFFSSIIRQTLRSRLFGALRDIPQNGCEE